MNLRNIYSKFWDFLRNPKDEADNNQSLSFKFQNVLALLLLEIPIMAVILSIMALLENAGMLNTENHSLVEFLKNSPIYVIIPVAVLLIPFLEELIFRLYLRYEWNPFLKIVLLIGKLSKSKRQELYQESLRDAWHKNYKFVIYFSAAFFAIIHLANFENNMYALLIVPILVAPQFVIGLFLAFLRVRFGLLSGYALHAVHNLIFIMIPFLFMLQNVEVINVKTKDYELKIEEVALADKEMKIVFAEDSIIVKNMTLKSSIAGLLNVDEYEIECDHDKKLENSLNIRMKNFSKDTEMNSILLAQLKKHYHFEIDTIVKFKDTWELLLIDVNKLTKFRSKSSNFESKVNQSSGKHIFTNVSLAIIANSIATKFNQKLSYKGSDTLFYDFTLEIDDFENLAKELEQFGLTLKKTQANVISYKVRFLNSKNNEKL